jgi:tetratricopeptide (TPR) repeat protein
MPRSRLPLPLIAIALSFISACSSLQSSGRAGARIDIDSYLLLGQIAIEEQQLERATAHYLNAAMISTDPALAERATRMALRLSLNDAGREAVGRWQRLSPDDERAAYFVGIFEFRARRLDESIAAFAALLETLDADALGSGFALVLEALAAEPSAQAATAVMAALTERFPGTPEGHYGLARLALRSGNFDLALENAARAVELVPDWLEAELLHARTLLLAGRSEEGLALAARLADASDDVEVRLQYAELLLSAGESDAAEDRLNDILSDNPGMPEAIRALAFLALTAQELDSAKERFETLRGDASYRDEAFYYLGRIAEQQEDYLQATRSYARVIEGTHAVEAQVRTSLILYSEMADSEGALRHLREFGSANPRFSSEMLLAEGHLLLQMRQPERAIALLDDALADARSDGDPTLLDAHIRFYVALTDDAISRNELDEAESWLDDGLERYPDNPSLRYSLAILLQERGQLDRAVTVLEQLVVDRPDDAAFLNALGYLLTDKFDRHTEARDYIQRALAMNPDSAAIIDSMGWVLFRLGDYESALGYLERAYRLMDNSEVLAHLVDVYFALGQQDTARELLQGGLAELPDDPFLNEVSQRLMQ